MDVAKVFEKQGIAKPMLQLEAECKEDQKGRSKFEATPKQELEMELEQLRVTSEFNVRKSFVSSFLCDFKSCLGKIQLFFCKFL